MMTISFLVALQALRLLVDTNDKASIATCTMHIGATFCAEGDNGMGIQKFKTALMVGDAALGGWNGKVDCLNHLATAQVPKS